jgi:hypothetical protein
MEPVLRPVVLVCGCERYRSYLSAAIRRLSRPEYEIIGIVGGHQEAFDPATRILTLTVPDTYEALPTKIQAAIAWIHKERKEIPGIFKTDDDIVVDPALLARTILANQAQDYWGFVVQTTRGGPISRGRIQTRFADTSLHPSFQAATYCFGHGYWISSAVIPHIVASTDYASSYLEDICTGYVLNRVGVFPTAIKIPYTEWPRIPKLLSLK